MLRHNKILYLQYLHKKPSVTRAFSLESLTFENEVDLNRRYVNSGVNSVSPALLVVKAMHFDRLQSSPSVFLILTPGRSDLPK